MHNLALHPIHSTDGGKYRGPAQSRICFLHYERVAGLPKNDLANGIPNTVSAADTEASAVDVAREIEMQDGEVF
jgi:hypothetical protein